MDSMDEELCPICVEPLDASDRAVNYCDCGYRICMFCWKQLMETAANDNVPGRCPNCRSEYDVQKITMSQVDPELVQEDKRRRKDRKDKGVTPAVVPKTKKELQHIRVVQRNLVYTVGLPLSICREETLGERQHFGQYGRIKKVSVNRQAAFAGNQGRNGPTGSAYVTFYRNEDAAKCIAGVDGQVWEGKTIKACFGTTKYCNAFLKGVICNNPDCLYLHDVADDADSFHKDDMQANGLIPGAGIGDFFAAIKAPPKGAKVPATTPPPVATAVVAQPTGAAAGPSAAAAQNPPPGLKPSGGNPWNASVQDGSPPRGTWAAPPPRPLPPPIGLSEEWPSLAPAAKDDGSADDEKSKHESGEFSDGPKAQPVKAGTARTPKAAAKGKAGSAQTSIASHPTTVDAADFTPGSTPPEQDGKAGLATWDTARAAASAAVAASTSAAAGGTVAAPPKDVPINDQAAQQQQAGRAAGKEGKKGKAGAKAAAQPAAGAVKAETPATAQPDGGPVDGVRLEDGPVVSPAEPAQPTTSKAAKKGPPPGFVTPVSAWNGNEPSTSAAVTQLFDASDPVVYPQSSQSRPSSTLSNGLSPGMFSQPLAPSPSVSGSSSITLASWGKEPSNRFDTPDPSMDAPVALTPPARPVGGLPGLQGLRGPPPGFTAPANPGAASRAPFGAVPGLGMNPFMSDNSFDVNAFFTTPACLDESLADSTVPVSGASRMESRWTFARNLPTQAGAAPASSVPPGAQQQPAVHSPADQQDMLKFLRTIAPSAHVHLGGKEQAAAPPPAVAGAPHPPVQAAAPANPGIALLQQLRGGQFMQPAAAATGTAGSAGDPAIVVVKANADPSGGVDWQGKALRTNAGYANVDGLTNGQRFAPRGPPPGFAAPAAAQMPPGMYNPQHIVPAQRTAVNATAPPGAFNAYNVRT